MTTLSQPTPTKFNTSDTLSTLGTSGMAEPLAEPNSSAIPRPLNDPTIGLISDPKPDPIIAQARRNIELAHIDNDRQATPRFSRAPRAKHAPGPDGKNRTTGG